MNSKFLMIAAVLLMCTTAHAQNAAPSNTPGQRMQQRGSVPGDPGASGYSPGDQRPDRGRRQGSPGASGFAPGREAPSTTGHGGSMGGRDPERDPPDPR
jgi:hypothetical protein